jgi:carbamoylphosphate synthase small subunit
MILLIYNFSESIRYHSKPRNKILPERSLALQISALTNKMEALSFRFGHRGNNDTVRRVKEDPF